MLFFLIAYNPEESIGSQYVSNSVLYLFASTEESWLVVDFADDMPSWFSSAYLFLNGGKFAAKSSFREGKRINITFPYIPMTELSEPFYLLESNEKTVLHRISVINNMTHDYDRCFMRSKVVRADSSSEICIYVEPTNCRNVFERSSEIFVYYVLQNSSVQFKVEDSAFVNFEIAKIVGNQRIYTGTMDDFYNEANYYCMNCNWNASDEEVRLCKYKLFLSYEQPSSLIYLYFKSNLDSSWSIQTSVRQIDTSGTCDMIFCKKLVGIECLEYYHNIEITEAILFVDQLYIEMPIVTVMARKDLQIELKYWLVEQPYILNESGQQEIYQSDNYCDYDLFIDRYSSPFQFQFANLHFNRVSLRSEKCRSQNATEYHVLLDAVRIDNSTGQEEIVNHCHTSERLEMVEYKSFKVVFMRNEMCSNKTEEGLFILWEQNDLGALVFVAEERYNPDFEYRGFYCVNYVADISQRIYQLSKANRLFVFYRSRNTSRDYWVRNIDASFFSWGNYYLLFAGLDVVFVSILFIILSFVKIQ